MKRFLLYSILLSSSFSFTQEVFPIYTDYLSDNLFLIHPSAAGIGNCSKLRLTYQRQWAGIENAPSLQTLSFHSRISDKAALGGTLFNDENGFHAQRGVSGSYAYHLDFSEDEKINQLSFGILFAYVQNTIDKTSFTSSIFDPVNTQAIESANNISGDFSIAYHYLDVFVYATVKNLFFRAKDFETSTYQSLNLSSYLVTFGHYFGRGKGLQFEPSIMTQYIDRTEELFIDFNFKVYKKNKNNNQLWLAVSYRQSFEQNSIDKLKQITPIVGFDYKRYVVSYTYTHQLNEVVLTDGGFHQVTLGVNLFCKKPRATGCPNVNAMF